MARRQRNTLKADAYAVACLGRAMGDLAHDHRVAASAIERHRAEGNSRAIDDTVLARWIATACELSAATERLLELEVELARSYGMTWEAIADILGVTRQAAWERFRSHVRTGDTHRLTRLRRVHRAQMLRWMTKGQNDEIVAAVRQVMGIGSLRAGVEARGHRPSA